MLFSPRDRHSNLGSRQVGCSRNRDKRVRIWDKELLSDFSELLAEVAESSMWEDNNSFGNQYGRRVLGAGWKISVRATNSLETY